MTHDSKLTEKAQYLEFSWSTNFLNSVIGLKLMEITLKKLFNILGTFLSVTTLKKYKDI